MAVCALSDRHWTDSVTICLLMYCHEDISDYIESGKIVWQEPSQTSIDIASKCTIKMTMYTYVCETFFIEQTLNRKFIFLHVSLSL